MPHIAIIIIALVIQSLASLTTFMQQENDLYKNLISTFRKKFWVSIVPINDLFTPLFTPLLKKQ